jgi:hypothetical protein
MVIAENHQVDGSGIGVEYPLSASPRCPHTTPQCRCSKANAEEAVGASRTPLVGMARTPISRETTHRAS